MNRVIKFRVWDKLEKRFDSNHHLTMDLNGRVYNLQNGAGGEDYEIQQFTGLLDKNGVEIYEGDWVKHPYGIASVQYGRYLCNGGLAHSGFYLDFASKNIGLDGTLEVIGNIFENPELLTK